METIIKIQILDEVYKFKAEGDATDAQRVGDFLTAEFRRLEYSLGASAQGMGKVAKLLLLAMNVANTYASLKQQHDEMIAAFDEGSEGLLKILP